MYILYLLQVNGFTGEEVTYGHLQTRITRVASALIKMGLQKGDVVTIVAPNSPEYSICYLGVAAAGGVASAVNPLYTASKWELTIILSL